MEALAALTCGASVDDVTTYELGDSDPDPLQALVLVRLCDPVPVRFERFLSSIPDVIAAWHVHGTPTYVIDEADVRLRCRQPGLELVGFDCSVGHQVSRFSVYEQEVRRIVGFCAAMHARHGADVTRLNLGGWPGDPGVSRLHALLLARAGGWALLDPGSVGGAAVDGVFAPIPADVPVPLGDGSRIHMGVWTTITLHSEHRDAC